MFRHMLLSSLAACALGSSSAAQRSYVPFYGESNLGPTGGNQTEYPASVEYSAAGVSASGGWCGTEGVFGMAAPHAYQSGRLPEPPGNNHSWATDCNASGKVVGWAYPIGNATQVGVLWENGQAIEVTGLAGSLSSFAYGISDDGAITGVCRMSGGWRFYRSFQGETKDLGPAPAPAWDFSVRTNNAGQVAFGTEGTGRLYSQGAWQNVPFAVRDLSESGHMCGGSMVRVDGFDHDVSLGFGEQLFGINSSSVAIGRRDDGSMFIWHRAMGQQPVVTSGFRNPRAISDTNIIAGARSIETRVMVPATLRPSGTLEVNAPTSVFCDRGVWSNLGFARLGDVVDKPGLRLGVIPGGGSVRIEFGGNLSTSNPMTFQIRAMTNRDDGSARFLAYDWNDNAWHPLTTTARQRRAGGHVYDALLASDYTRFIRASDGKVHAILRYPFSPGLVELDLVCWITRIN